VDKPIPTFTDINKPVKYLVEKDQPAVVPIATNLYNINTASLCQNDTDLSGITATTDVKVLRLACSLAQIKFILNDTDLPNNTPVSEIYDKVKQQRINGLIYGELYLSIVSAFVRSIDIFDAESTFP